VSTHPLATARRRLENAKREIGDLHTSIREFFKLKPYSNVIDKDTKPGYHLYKVKLFVPFPDHWPNDVAHIASDLRSPLDYAVGRVLEQDAAGLAQIKNHSRGLPICRNAETLERELRKRKILTVYPKLGDFITNVVKPYNGGNDLICHLDTLNNSNKHWDLYPTGMAGPILHINEMIISGSYFGIAGGYKGALSKDSVTFFEASPDTKFEGNIKFRLDVALTKIDGFEGKPVVLALSQIANEVERLLSAFEQEFFR
jgi:hypothetical protein